MLEGNINPSDLKGIVAHRLADSDAIEYFRGVDLHVGFQTNYVIGSFSTRFSRLSASLQHKG